MGKTNFAKPVNSHLIMFDQPKVSIVKGYIERVFGMLISQHVDEYDAVVTNRTILCDEELNSTWSIHDNENDSLTSLHYFKSFPQITMKDVAAIVSQTCGTRYLFESFDELKELGCIVPDTQEPLVMKAFECSKYFYFQCGEIRVESLSKWIPASLEYLYSIQSFLNRQIVLETYNNNVSPEVLAMMNELLENQRKHKIYTSGESLNGEKFYNDGVNTYGTNGFNASMTREEFMTKYPDAYEVGG